MNKIKAYFAEKVYKEKGVFHCLINITNRCNAKCKFCFRGNQDKTLELSTDKWKETLLELKSLFCYGLQISGGEPLIREDSLEIIKFARKHGFSVVLTTNGTLLTEEQIDTLSELYIERIIVSVHSLDNEINKEIMGYNYEVENLIKSIKMMVNRNIRVVISIVLNKYNIDEFNDFEDFFKNIGVYSVNAAIMHASHNKQNNVNLLNDLLPTDEQIRVFYKKNPNRLYEQDKTGFVCSGGRENISIDPDGSVFPCSQARIKFGNLISEDLNDIIKKSSTRNLINMIKWEQFTQCNKCVYSKWCDHCYGINESETGNVFEPSPTKCRIAKIRYEIKEMEKQ